jgi:uncharacterized NAD(P)/FAD-binding protein YdhS
VHAISRHGLLPPRQTAFRHSRAQFDVQPLLRAATTSTRQLCHLVRGICAEAERRGGDWREAITFVRTVAPKLWSKLPDEERRRFMRHVRPYWDIHRHRLPPGARAAIDTLRREQRLQVHAGRIVSLAPDGDQVRVTWRPRGLTEQSALHVDRVINCTGPNYRLESSRDPLIRELLSGGLIRPDAVGAGLRTVGTGGVLNLFGRATRGLYYIGPMLRADHWEATAVPELRAHAESLGRQLALPAFSTAAVNGAG